jgi:hypothetical protein
MHIHLTAPITINGPCLVKAMPGNTDYVAAGQRRLFPGDTELFVQANQSILVEGPGQSIAVLELDPKHIPPFYGTEHD